MAIPNYRVALSYDSERKVFLARAPELEHCHGEGATRAEAIGKLEEEMRAQIDSMHAHGSTPPAAVDESLPSGDLRIKLSATLHRDLLWQARQDGVEVDQLVSELLAAGIAGSDSRRGGGARSRGPAPNRAPADPSAHDNIGNTIGGPGGGNANRGNNRNNRGYNPAILDDRANFIEYVRTLDSGPQQGGFRGPPGGGPGPNRNNNRRRGPGGPGGGGGGGGRGPGPGPGGAGGGRT